MPRVSKMQILKIKKIRKACIIQAFREADNGSRTRDLSTTKVEIGNVNSFSKYSKASKTAGLHIIIKNTFCCVFGNKGTVSGAVVPQKSPKNNPA